MREEARVCRGGGEVTETLGKKVRAHTLERNRCVKVSREGLGKSLKGWKEDLRKRGNHWARED